METEHMMDPQQAEHLKRQLAGVRGQITRLRRQEAALLAAIEHHRRADVAIGIAGGIAMEAAGIGIGAMIG